MVGGPGKGPHRTGRGPRGCPRSHRPSPRLSLSTGHPRSRGTSGLESGDVPCESQYPESCHPPQPGRGRPSPSLTEARVLSQPRRTACRKKGFLKNRETPTGVPHGVPISFSPAEQGEIWEALLSSPGVWRALLTKPAAPGADGRGARNPGEAAGGSARQCLALECSEGRVLTPSRAGRNAGFTPTATPVTGNPRPERSKSEPWAQGCPWALWREEQGQTRRLALTVQKPPATREARARSLGGDDPLEEGMATHSSILVWRIPWTEKPEGLWSMGSQRVGHN